jgi:glycosyltransferase involved in cell wall biosynthesis
MKPKVVVCTPIFERAWILPKWLDALEAQKADVDLVIYFCLTQGTDATEDMIQRAASRFNIRVFMHPKGDKEDHSRDWTDAERVRVIADKRNTLIAQFRQNPEGDYLLMLDSDVLVPPGGIMKMIETAKFDGFDAVCPKVWVWSAFYVAMKYTHGRLAFLPRRERGIHPVDVVTSSACLMVQRLAVDARVRYGVAERGKDFGWAPGHEINGWNASECVYWSKQAKAATYRLGVNCGVVFDHKMKEGA